MTFKKQRRFIITTIDKDLYYCDGYILNKRKITPNYKSAKIITTKYYAVKICELLQQQYTNKKWEVVEL